MPNPWPNHSLLEEECEEVEIFKEEVHIVATRGQLCIVGKLVVDRYVSKETIKNALLKWWKPLGSIFFKVLGENLFLIEFENSRDKEKVLEGRPWVFEGALFLVKDFANRSSP